MNQDFKHSYKDSSLEVTLEAQNDQHSWANIQDLTKALLDIVKCTSDWKKFELYIVVKSQVKSQGKSQDHWQPDPDLA